MQKTETILKPKLVRTTVRLPQSLYLRLKRRSVDEGQPLQALIITDLERAEVKQAYTKADDILKYTLKLKDGQKLFDRGEFYDEVLKHRVRSH